MAQEQSRPAIDTAASLDFGTICENCQLSLGEHKGWHCVKGPKYFRLIADTDYKGQLLPKPAR